MVLPLKDWPIPKGKTSPLPPWPTVDGREEVPPDPDSVFFAEDKRLDFAVKVATVGAFILLGALACWKLVSM